MFHEKKSDDTEKFIQQKGTQIFNITSLMLVTQPILKDITSLPEFSTIFVPAWVVMQLND